MFCVTESDAAAIRTAFDQGGEFSAAVELRRLFPGVNDMTEARAWARTLASWTPPPVPPAKEMRRPQPRRDRTGN